MFRHWLWAATLAGLCLTATSPVLLAQKDSKKDDKKAESKKEDSKKEDSKKDDKKVRHVLPRYYADVVDDAQRDKIYAIQDKYADDIHKLQDELDALKAKRDKEIEGVLTSAQKAKIAAAKEDKGDDEKKDSKDSKKTDDKKDSKKSDEKDTKKKAA